MRVQKTIKENKALIWIIALAALFLLWNVSKVDLIGDDAHYTIRSIGFVDMMFSDQQTTPINWFDHFPWWANLSFHDHPALLFLIQHVFLSISETLFFAKLPYILFSLSTIFLLYLFVKKNDNKNLAIWSATFIFLNSLFLWVGRTAYLESGVAFFVLLAIYYFFKFIEKQNYWPYFGLTLGLAILTKYNTLFLLPTIFVYLLLSKREMLRKKQFYYALILMIITISPSIIYNIMMYKTVGHFDYQFSRLFGQDTPWKATGATLDLKNIVSIFTTLAKSITYPYLILSALGFWWGLKQKKTIIQFFSIAVIFITIMFSLTGAGIWHLSIYNIFFAPAAAYGFLFILEKIKNKRTKKILISIIFAYLLIIAFQAHITTKNFLSIYPGLSNSIAKSENVGIYQMDVFLKDLIEKNKITDVRDGYREIKSKKKSLTKRYGSSEYSKQKPATEFDHMIVYDENINWFGELWLFKRRRFYHNLPILSTDEFARFGDQISIKKLYLIRPTEYSFLENTISNRGEEMEGVFIEQGIKPEVVTKSNGQEVYKIYTIELSNSSI